MVSCWFLQSFVADFYRNLYLYRLFTAHSLCFIHVLYVQYIQIYHRMLCDGRLLPGYYIYRFFKRQNRWLSVHFSAAFHWLAQWLIPGGPAPLHVVLATTAITATTEVHTRVWLAREILILALAICALRVEKNYAECLDTKDSTGYNCTRTLSPRPSSQS